MTTFLAPAPRAATVARAEDASDNTSPATDGNETRPQLPGRPGRPGQSGGLKLLGGLVSVFLNLVAPLLAYRFIKHDVSSSAVALALSGLIPVVYTLAILAIQRRISPLGMVGVVTYGLGCLLSWACGGSTLAQELQDPVFTGLFGLACLGSVVIKRPLHRVILRWMGRDNPHYTEVADRVALRSSMITTTIIGVTFLVHAVAVAILADTQTTSTYLALANPIGLGIIGVGLGGLFLYGNLQRARQSQAEKAATAQAAAETAAGDQGDEQA